METNVQKIKELSEARHDENWRFRTFLKGCSDVDIDALVQHFYQEVSSHIDCTACANCCKEIQPTLDQEDIQQFAQGLGMSVVQLTEHYLMQDVQDGSVEGWTFREKPCPFLKENRCTNYLSRPQACRSYPHLQKPNFTSRLWGVIDNCAICPIVFNVYEWLKTELWFHTRLAPSTKGTSPTGIRVHITDLIDGIELQMDDTRSYLNRETAEVVTVSHEELHAAETNAPLEQFPDWQHHMIHIAKDILESEKYLMLPSTYEMHEYHLMEQFCLSIADEELMETMYHAIKGRGAFRRFKDNIYRYDIADEWYAYRDNALKQMAMNWCARNGIAYSLD